MIPAELLAKHLAPLCIKALDIKGVLGQIIANAGEGGFRAGSRFFKVWIFIAFLYNYGEVLSLLGEGADEHLPFYFCPEKNTRSRISIPS
ncbi:hypothetical protein Y981_08625 [Leptospirillum ferriphilum YSK]|uniref:Uncharacterized protein n=1 Tax=Leptospirillum ferriphilum YSK TaxID=1441628 RepID=A0A059Y2X4_9BACT|nr:hypothetical protein Y981_08625 [Leptospirillum ferriphilum YSK]